MNKEEILSKLRELQNEYEELKKNAQGEREYIYASGQRVAIAHVISIIKNIN